MGRLLVTSFLCLVLAGTTGCAGVRKPDQTGFISDYSRLEQVADDTLLYVDDTLGDYDSFIIDPATLLFERDEENATFTNEELTELLEHFADRVESELTRDEGYAIVSEPGSNVARIRLGITDVDKTIGALNISLVTKVTGAGIGGASTESEIVDAVTGEQIAAFVRWGGGSRVLRAGITKTGDAKLAINRWARGVRTMVDEAHGR